MTHQDEQQRQTRDSTTQEVVPSTRKARLVALAGKESGKVYRFSSKVLMGRDTAASVRIDAPDVSRRHARMWRSEEDGGWIIEDLKSSNGTWVNGLQVEGKQPVKFGDRIQLGGSVLFIFAHHDILEEQVQQLQKLESLGQLAGGVAHDFNNLLTVFSANLQLVRLGVDCGQIVADKGLGAEELKSYVEQMQAATRSAGDLVRRLLTFSRKGTGARRPVDLSQVVEEVAAMCSKTFPKEVKLEQQVEPLLVVSGDSTELQQALMNLCINARDAMSGKGRLVISAEQLRVEAVGEIEVPLGAPGEYAVVAVSDDGQGMDDEIRRRVFEPFFTTKSAGQGTGLGLAMVYTMVKDMGGNVQLQSWPGEGTTVRLYLPLAARSEAFRATDHGGRMPREQSSPTLRKESVLVVDDDRRVRRDLILMLEQLGYDPMVAADGAEGVLLYQKHQRRIRAVLLDMVMPGMGGEQVFKMLSKIDPRVCVLVISGHATIQDMQGLLTQGVRGCLPKPFDRDQLQQALTEALSQETLPPR